MKSFKSTYIFTIIFTTYSIFSSCKKEVVEPLPQIPVYIPSTPQTSIYSTLELLESDTLFFSGTSVYDGIVASAGNKILIAGGNGFNIYDVNTEQWVIKHLSEPRDGMTVASYNNKIFLAGGYYNGLSNIVDIYDVTTEQWTVSHLRVAREGMTSTSAGNLIFFAGGNDVRGPSKVVEIYDVTTGQWSISELSLPRTDLAAASAGNIVCFAGGRVSGFPSNIDSVFAYRVDIYDASTGKWSISKLSQGRTFLAGAAAGNKILFAGGWFGGNNISNVVDVYDVTTGQWTCDQLDLPRTNLASVSAGNLILFAGGENWPDTTFFNNNIEIYNTLTGQWTTKIFPNLNLYGFRFAASAGNKILFSNGYAVDIFELK